MVPKASTPRNADGDPLPCPSSERRTGRWMEKAVQENGSHTIHALLGKVLKFHRRKGSLDVTKEIAGLQIIVLMFLNYFPKRKEKYQEAGFLS